MSSWCALYNIRLGYGDSNIGENYGAEEKHVFYAHRVTDSFGHLGKYVLLFLCAKVRNFDTKSIQRHTWKISFVVDDLIAGLQS